MILKQIEYFVVLAEEKSFTETGFKFNVSQSAVSQQILALEKELGVNLISKACKKFKLTEAGEYFYNKGKNILAMIENLKEQTIDIGKNNERILNIGFLNSYFGGQLNEAIKQLVNVYPDLELNVLSGTHESIYELLKKNEISLAISDQRRALSDEFENKFVKECCYAIYARKGIYQTQKIDVEEATKLPYIIIARLEEQQTEKIYFNDLLNPNSSCIFVNNFEEAKLLVNAGLGQLLVDDLFYNKDKDFDLIKLSKNSIELRKKYFIFWKLNKTNDYIKELAKLLSTKF